MKSIEQISHLREIFAQTGENLSETARVLGWSRDTVRKYLGFDFSKPVQPVRRKKVHPFDDVIKALIVQNKKDLQFSHKNRLSPKRIHTILCASHGCSLSLRSVERRVKIVRRSMTAAPMASLVLKKLPGRGQVDFGFVNAYIAGRLRSLSVLILSFSFSNACLAVACEGQNACCLFEALGIIFATLGGVPPVLRFDNLKPAVSLVNRQRKMTEDFQRFALHYGFKPEFCNPACGNEKGNVENKVGYLRENFFVPVPSFASMAELNAALQSWCVADRDRIHYQLGEKISELFSEDLGELRRLPCKPFECFDEVSGVTDNCGFVQFDNNFYFAGISGRRRPVLVRASASTVQLFDDDLNLIASHKRSYGRGERVQSVQSLAALLSHKLGAFEYVAKPVENVGETVECLRALPVGERQQAIVEFLTDSPKRATKPADRLPVVNYNPNLSIYDKVIKNGFLPERNSSALLPP